jgi:hypothetical protein
MTMDKVNYHPEKRLLIKSQNNKLPNYYSPDDLLYYKNSQAIKKHSATMREKSPMASKH